MACRAATLAFGADRAVMSGMRPTDRNRFRKDAEGRFPIKVDVRVPGSGEPWPFAEMLGWCRASIAAGAWAQHGFMDKKRRDERGIPIDFARFYFMTEADAEAFNRRWLDGAATAEIDLQRDLEPTARTYRAARSAGATDLAARLAADAAFRRRRPGTLDDETARRVVDRLIKTAAERGMLRPIDSDQVK